MNQYDPEQTPDPDSWLELDEMDRFLIIELYHAQSGIKLPNQHLHAVIHSVVENHVAMGEDLPVEKTLKRLVSEGLTRHDALHAIGSVLAENIFDMEDPDGDASEIELKYFHELAELTAENWKRKCEDSAAGRTGAP